MDRSLLPQGKNSRSACSLWRVQLEQFPTNIRCQSVWRLNCTGKSLIIVMNAFRLTKAKHVPQFRRLLFMQRMRVSCFLHRYSRYHKVQADVNTGNSL